MPRPRTSRTWSPRATIRSTGCHRFVVEYFRMCRLRLKGQAPRGPAPAVVEFAPAAAHLAPREAAHAFVPLVEMLEGLLADAIEARRRPRRPRRPPRSPGRCCRRPCSTRWPTPSADRRSSTARSAPRHSGICCSGVSAPATEPKRGTMNDTDVRTVRSFCRICTSVCGILVDVAGDDVVRVRGDQDHPLSHGYTCAKGRALPQMHHHPDRIEQTAGAGRRRAPRHHLGGVPRRPRRARARRSSNATGRPRSACSSAAATAWTPPATACRRHCSRRSERRPSSARSPSTAPPRCWCPTSSAARSRSAGGPTTTVRRS